MDERMFSIPRVLILCQDLSGKRWLECGIQDGFVVGMAGVVSRSVPIRVVYLPKKGKTAEGFDIDEGAATANQIIRDLKSFYYGQTWHSYLSVEAVDGSYKRGKKSNESSLRPDAEPFTFTLNATRVWDDKYKCLSEKPTEFGHLHITCPCCGTTEGVLMPGNKKRGKKWSEPYCTRCHGVVRLLPKHVLTADMLAKMAEPKESQLEQQLISTE